MYKVIDQVRLGGPNPDILLSTWAPFLFYLISCFEQNGPWPYVYSISCQVNGPGTSGPILVRWGRRQSKWFQKKEKKIHIIFSFLKFFCISNLSFFFFSLFSYPNLVPRRQSIQAYLNHLQSPHFIFVVLSISDPSYKNSIPRKGDDHPGYRAEIRSNLLVGSFGASRKLSVLSTFARFTQGIQTSKYIS